MDMAVVEFMLLFDSPHGAASVETAFAVFNATCTEHGIPQEYVQKINHCGTRTRFLARWRDVAKNRTSWEVRVTAERLKWHSSPPPCPRIHHEPRTQTLLQYASVCIATYNPAEKGCIVMVAIDTRTHCVVTNKRLSQMKADLT